MADDRTDELTPAWLSSVLVVWDAQGVAQVLAGPGAGPLPGDGSPLHVLTSQDPGGEPQAPERNQELLADLIGWAIAEVGVPGDRWWPVTGWEAASGHAEQGIALAGWTRAAASALGERFGQLAIYEVTADELRVVPCPGAEVSASALRTLPTAAGPTPSRTELDAWWDAYRRAGVVTSA